MSSHNGQSCSRSHNNHSKKPSVSFKCDTLDPSNNKITLSVLEERRDSGSNSDTQSKNSLPNLKNSSSNGSSLENLQNGLKHLAITPFAHSSGRLNDIPEQSQLVSRRPSILLQEILSTRRPSAIMAAIRRPSNSFLNRSRLGAFQEDNHNGSTRSINFQAGPKSELAMEFRRKNRRVGNDALSTALSALYAQFIVIIGIALPVTEILSSRIPATFYQGFYVYLYVVSIAFVAFVLITNMRTRAMFSIIKNYHEKNNDFDIKKRAPQFGSFYLRVGAICFGIGTMVYSGLEFGQYFELNPNSGCNNIFIALTPLCRMTLSIVQMQFVFLNTTELDLGRHKVISRFGLMHMVATNLCEWLYVLVEETKHEMFHLSHGHDNNVAHYTIPGNTTHNLNETILNTTHAIIRRSVPVVHSNDQYADCQRTNIMGTLVQNASPFLFPCTIEYSLICAVILFEMWKKVRSIPEIQRSRKNSLKSPPAHQIKDAHHFSIDCSRAHRGMFAGIIVIVLTIISLIMYFVLHEEPSYVNLAITEVTYYEIVLYTVCTVAVFYAMYQMRDMKFQRKSGNNGNDHHVDSVKLDCTLLVLAGIGVYVYGMFSIMGSFFAMQDDMPGGRDALVAEILSLLQVSVQTLFILNACWRRTKGTTQNRIKPGRQVVTFLLVANMSIWFINTLIKGQASFRPNHVEFFGMWAWAIITHCSMPLAIFYRFHSTICLFDIWKSAYKNKPDH